MLLLGQFRMYLLGISQSEVANILGIDVKPFK